MLLFLVTFASAAEAINLLEFGRKFCFSNCEYTRQNIYINTDMTKLELKAVYEEK